MTLTRRQGFCTSCQQDGVDVEPRRDHGERILCDPCAANGTSSSAHAPTTSDGPLDVFRLLTADELLALPEPSWLLEGLVPSAGLTVLYGASGAGKSFLALDWALCVAAGLPWHGHSVESHWVVYVAAEGLRGLGLRYRAWLTARGIDGVDRIRFLADAVNLLDGSIVERAQRTLATLPHRPALLVVDTMARTIVGGDENSAKDVGLFVHAVDALRGGGAALVVHHTGHEGERERGSSALRAAADARLQLTRTERSPLLTLTNPKQKDGAEHPSVNLRLEPVASSLVLSLVTPVDAAREAEQAADYVKAQVLAFVIEHGPVSKRKVREAVKGRASRIDDALGALQLAGKVIPTPKGLKACPDLSDTVGHADSAGDSEQCVREGGTGTKSLPGRDTLSPVSGKPCPDDADATAWEAVAARNGDIDGAAL